MPAGTCAPCLASYIQSVNDRVCVVVGQVLGGAFITGYGPPSGFCFDSRCSDANPIQDDPRLEDNNVDYMVDLFVRSAQNDAYVSATDNVMFLMGSDFQHENSNEWFKNRTCLQCGVAYRGYA